MATRKSESAFALERRRHGLQAWLARSWFVRANRRSMQAVPPALQAWLARSWFVRANRRSMQAVPPALLARGHRNLLESSVRAKHGTSRSDGAFSLN
ncbi:MAG: hypothetical protein DMF68_00505 [Acidobacteria bacterium]|nr:MAG: hypothetical protein DMF68_00505 [Acidobacteriota bacterium]